MKRKVLATPGKAQLSFTSADQSRVYANWQLALAHFRALYYRLGQEIEQVTPKKEALQKGTALNALAHAQQLEQLQQLMCSELSRLLDELDPATQESDGLACLHAQTVRLQKQHRDVHQSLDRIRLVD